MSTFDQILTDKQKVKAAGADFEAGWSAAQETVIKAMQTFTVGSPEHNLLWNIWTRDMGRDARLAARAEYVEEIYPAAAVSS